MKVARLFSFSILLLLFNCSYQVEKNDLNNLFVNAPIHKQIEKKYSINAEIVGKKKLVKTSICKFNKAGNIETLTTVFNSELGRNESTGKFIYNSKNQKVKELVRFDDLAFEINYYYQGTRLIKTEGKIKDKESNLTTIQTENYFYDSKRKLKSHKLESLSIEEDRKDTIILESATFLYNSDGFLYEINWDTINNHTLPEKTVYKRNREGLIIKELKMNSSDSILATINYEYEYDDRKNWIKLKKFKNQKLSELIERQLYYD